MHRTSPWAWSYLLGGLLALSLGGPCSLDAIGQTCTPDPRVTTVPVNGTVRLQMLSKKRIRTATNPKEGILELRSVDGDPSSVLVLGRAAGFATIELEDADGVRESRNIAVQADVEFLTHQLRRAVPQSRIDVIPFATNYVALAGYVQSAEDISVAQAIAQSSGFQVVQRLRLNGGQQVQLDVVIAQVRRTKGRNFGFNFLQNARRELFGSTIGNLIPIGANPIGVPSGSFQPAGAGQVLNVQPGQATLFGGVLSTNAGFLGFLQALQSEGLAKIISQPRLTVQSGQTASLLSGGEQAIPVPAGLGVVGVQFEEFGTRLNVLPIVLGNGRIRVEIEPEVSTLDPNAGVAIAGATVAGRATQRVHTTVELESGQTFVIGGLIQKVTTGQANKVPVLGQLPFIGAAFSTKSHTDDESELVVLVTPHFVDAQSADQVVKVLPGQETRTPDDFELFLEGILEAPRGPRAVFVNGRYVPAHRNGPTSNLFPCASPRDGVRTLHGGHTGGIEEVHGSVNCPPAVSPVGPALGNPRPANQPLDSQGQLKSVGANIVPPVLVGPRAKVKLPVVEEQPVTPAGATEGFPAIPTGDPANGKPALGQGFEQQDGNGAPLIQTAAPDTPQVPIDRTGGDN